MFRALARSHNNRQRLLGFWRRNPDAVRTALVTITLLLVASSAWFSLIFSASGRQGRSPQRWQNSPPLPLPHPELIPLPVGDETALELRHLVFGIAGSAQLWQKRKEFVKLWWEPDHMRGFVWLEEPSSSSSSHSASSSENDLVSDEPLLPPIRLSDDISRFPYTNPTGHPSGVRIARIVQETFKLGLPGVRWFVLGDDDTVFNVPNLVRVLGKYDPSQMHYIGCHSESHSANTYFSHNMAFGGGGIAISYPLAEALTKMEDACLDRYTHLFGSDDRLHACISELGVPLTRELGFHQWDIRGNAFGLLAGHPVAPFVSMHHLEVIDPIFPNYSALDGLKLLMKAMKTEPMGFLQRAICYSQKKLTFSVTMGYVVQVFPMIIYPRDLDRPERTFMAWNKRDRADDFDIDTRPPYRSYCNKPFLFYFDDIYIGEGNTVVSSYKRDSATDDKKRREFCLSWAFPSHEVQEIKVVSKHMTEGWHLVPKRQCCQLTGMQDKVLGISVDSCEQGRISFT